MCVGVSTSESFLNALLLIFIGVPQRPDWGLWLAGWLLGWTAPTGDQVSLRSCIWLVLELFSVQALRLRQFELSSESGGKLGPKCNIVSYHNIIQWIKFPVVVSARWLWVRVCLGTGNDSELIIRDSIAIYPLLLLLMILLLGPGNFRSHHRDNGLDILFGAPQALIYSRDSWAGKLLADKIELLIRMRKKISWAWDERTTSSLFSDD